MFRRNSDLCTFRVHSRNASFGGRIRKSLLQRVLNIELQYRNSERTIVLLLFSDYHTTTA